MTTVGFRPMFRKLTSVRSKPIYVVLERRNNQRKWGTANYGEMPQFINAADGDPWDVVVPGYPTLQYDEPYKFKKLLGVYVLPNGNHKLIVDVYCGTKQDRDIVKSQMKKYQSTYEKHNKISGNIFYI